MAKKFFEGKNIFLVGGSEGIGLEAAKQFAGLGSNVLIFSRAISKLKKALTEIENCRINDGQKLSFMSLDITDNDQVISVMKKAGKEFGSVDILINNVGRAIPGYFEQISYEQFDQTQKVNFYGMRNTVAALAPIMREKKSGIIVNVSSMAGVIGVFGLSDYSASKFAVIGFSEVIRSEFQFDNIQVSVLCPPDTDTPGFEEENKTKPVETMALSESAKLRNPEYVAKALVKGIKKGKFLIVPGFDGKALVFLKRFMPMWVADMVMNSMIKKGRKKRQD